MEQNLVWKLISYFFLFYESYEIKFYTKISSLTVPQPIRCEQVMLGLELSPSFGWPAKESVPACPSFQVVPWQGWCCAGCGCSAPCSLGERKRQKKAILKWAQSRKVVFVAGKTRAAIEVDSTRLKLTMSSEELEDWLGGWYSRSVDRCTPA